MELFYGLLLSTHLGLEKEYNKIHPHVGMYIDSNYEWSVGTYYNSESKWSTYVARGFDFDNNKFVEVGLVTGYTGSPVKPMIKFNYDNWFMSPTVETIMRDGKAVRHNPGVVLGIEWRH